MKFLTDLVPLLLFFVALKFSDIYVATITAMIATTSMILWTWISKRKIDPMQWVSFGLILVFGGATIYLQDKTFIKWKPTILYWLFAIVFFVSNQIMKKNLVSSMLGTQVDLPAHIWSRLNNLWIVFFLLMGALNLYVAFVLFPTGSKEDDDAWGAFKVFGGMGLMLLFVLAQGMYMSRHLPKEGN
ncbi:MAG: hypothetical protein RIQ55_1241 [Pseudomonadota bacterium]|jgi:intracellular septation protein